jgi:uncharacterized protein
MKNEILSRVAECSSATFPFSSSCICAAVVGSAAHNTYIEKEDPTTDDVDLQGIFIPPPKYVIGLDNMESWVEQRDLEVEGKVMKYDWTFHSLKKFGKLLLDSNPNILCLLYLRDKDYILNTDYFRELRHNAHIFASLSAYNSFSGYAYSQLQRMERFETNGKMGEKRKLLVEKWGYDTKNAAHCLRLLYLGKQYIGTGKMTVWLPDEEADYLKSIKRGEVSLEDVKEEAERRFDEMRKVKEVSPLSPTPDHKRASNLIADLHISYWKDMGFL